MISTSRAKKQFQQSAISAKSKEEIGNAYPNDVNNENFFILNNNN